MSKKGAAEKNLGIANSPARNRRINISNVYDLFPSNEEYIYDTVRDRTELEMSSDKSYAEYWLDEYGTAPDQIRLQSIFPAIKSGLDKIRSDRSISIVDLGCGSGGCVEAILSWGGVSRYVGIDVNDDFLNAAIEKYEKLGAQFFRRDFDAQNWHKDTPSGFDLGLSIFVLNELKQPRQFLLGARHIVRRGGHLALVVTNPQMVLKDLVDYYLLGANRRKIEGVKGYKGADSGQYVFSRGDFRAEYHHHSLTGLYRMFGECGWRQIYFQEIYFQPNILPHGIENNRNMIEDQYPKALLILLQRHGKIKNQQL